MDRTDKLSPHFTLGELIKSETAERKGIDNMPEEAMIPKLKTLCEQILEPCRSHFGKPIRPSSGFRSAALNAAIGGSSNSQHCKAEAVDFEIHGVSNFVLAEWIRDNISFDQLILECYRSGEPNSGWVHVSISENPNENRKKVLTYTNRTYLNGLVA